MVFDEALYFSQLADEIRWGRGDQYSRLIADTEAGWPAFRNIGYALSVTPLVIQQDWHKAHKRNAALYVELLEKTIRLCASTPGISDYLGHSDLERAMVRTSLRAGRYITICRLDGYVDRGTGQLKLLENNSDAPAGILFSPRLNGLVRAIRRQLGGSGLEDSLADTQFDDPELTREMFAAFAKGGGEFAILQETGKVNVESREMVKAFSSAGLTTQVGDPGDLILERDGVRLGGRRIDVAWNKINTVHWRNYVHENPGQGERWLRILQDGKMVHLNHFGARLVTENKRCLSLLHEEQFTRLYDDSERDLIRKILPWATKFEPNKLVEWEGRRMEVTTLARSARERFVIKEPYDIRGDGVTVGYDCDSDQWNAKISQAVESGWVLQEYIAPLQLPVHHPMSSSAVRMCNLSLDTFVFNGEVAGYGAKASTRHRVNLFQGGQKVAVFVGVR